MDGCGSHVDMQFCFFCFAFCVLKNGNGAKVSILDIFFFLTHHRDVRFVFLALPARGVSMQTKDSNDIMPRRKCFWGWVWISFVYGFFVFAKHPTPNVTPENVRSQPETHKHKKIQPKHAENPTPEKKP